jgi:hypothetical protein
MKSILLTIALLSSPLVITTSNSDTVHTAATEQAPETRIIDEDPESGVDEDQGEDSFDALMDTDVPSDMIVQPKPVSPLEAYLKQIGVQVLMKYITLKIWLEHHWQSLTASRA